MAGGEPPAEGEPPAGSFALQWVLVCECVNHGVLVADADLDTVDDRVTEWDWDGDLVGDGLAVGPSFRKPAPAARYTMEHSRRAEGSRRRNWGRGAATIVECPRVGVEASRRHGSGGPSWIRASARL